MHAEMEDNPGERPAVEPSPPPAETQTGEGDPSLWTRAKQGLGKAATKVASAGTTAASVVSTAKSGAVSVATTVSTKGVSIASTAAKSAAAAGEHVVVTTGIDKAVEYLDSTLEERGVKKALGSAAGAVVDRLDQVTGKQLVELLESRLRLQDEYNDVLATRLAEALERIAALEEKLRHGHS